MHAMEPCGQTEALLVFVLGEVKKGSINVPHIFGDDQNTLERFHILVVHYTFFVVWVYTRGLQGAAERFAEDVGQQRVVM